MNLYGQDMDEQVSPLDAGLAWTVDLKSPRDFVGRRALEVKGQHAEFLGLVLLEAGGVLRGHQKVRAPNGEGEITSGTFSPTLGKSIALARLPRGTAPGDTVQVHGARQAPCRARGEAAFRAQRKDPGQLLKKRQSSMKIPKDLRYTESHEWVRRESDGSVAIGITDHAQEQLGDIVFVEAPQVGPQGCRGRGHRRGRIGESGFRHLRAHRR